MSDINKGQFDRAVKDFKNYAKGEAIKVEFIDGQFRVYTTELGMYRIAEVYKETKSGVWYGFSEGLESFIFTLDINGFTGEMATDGYVLAPSTARDSTQVMLEDFGKEMIALCAHRVAKSRPICESHINIDCVASDFLRQRTSK